MLEAAEIVSKDAVNALNAKSVMSSTNIVCVHEAESRAELERLLESTQHNGYPVVTTDSMGGSKLFAGIISRSSVVDILKAMDAKSTMDAKGSPSASNDASPLTRQGSPSASNNASPLTRRPSGSGAVSNNASPLQARRPSLTERRPSLTRRPSGSGAPAVAVTSESALASAPPASDGSPTPKNLRTAKAPSSGATASPPAELVDLRPHCDRSPYVVNQLLPLRRVFRLFTTMGLRHLVVVDHHSHVVGMITRKDFLKLRDGEVLSKQLSRRRSDTQRRLEEAGQQQVKSVKERSRAALRCLSISEADEPSSLTSPKRSPKSSAQAAGAAASSPSRKKALVSFFLPNAFHGAPSPTSPTSKTSGDSAV